MTRRLVFLLLAFAAVIGGILAGAGVASASAYPDGIPPGQPGYVRPSVSGVRWHAGNMRGYWNAPALMHWWIKDEGDGGNCPRRSNNYGVKLYEGNKVMLRTTGQVSSCSEISTPGLWTAGVFEMRVYYPAGPYGGIANFPATWMSGPGYLWPRYGEIDAAEAIQGWNGSTWHWNLAGPYGKCTSYRFPGECPAENVHRGISDRTGWYTIDIVRQSNGGIQVYYNGIRVQMFNTHYPVMPERVIIDNTSYSNAPPSTVYVAWAKIYNYK